ncbi:hypothetical protein UlMin_014460 [Ulmus minor]
MGYIHLYLINSSAFSLSLTHLASPTLFSCTKFLWLISQSLPLKIQTQMHKTSHVISSFSDLSFPRPRSPFMTFAVSGGIALSISTIHTILSFSSNNSLTKYKLNNNQTWLIFIYTSSPVSLSHILSSITSDRFSGIIRIALLPDSDSEFEAVLDRFSSCYPVSRDAAFTKPFCLESKWEKKGDSLLLAHPLHLQLFAFDDCYVTVLEDFRYKIIDGDLVGVVGDSWMLKPNLVSITWRSIRGTEEEAYVENVSALTKDVEALNSTTITTTSSYFYGKLIARATRLVIPAIKKFLKDTIEPWLDGNFSRNSFLFDNKWGGIITKDNSLVADFMTLGRRSNSVYPRMGTALMGLANGDTHLVATRSMLTSLEIQAAQMWWHVRKGDKLYEEDFTGENRVVGVLWAIKRDSALWFAPPAWKKELVKWSLPALQREGVGEGWKGFVSAREGIYDQEGALEKTRSLSGFDDGNSLTNLLWWIHSGDGKKEVFRGGGHGHCWFGHYCH